MSWSTLSINAPVSNAALITDALTVHTVSPWIDGNGLGINARLSFPNAAAAIAGLVDASSPALAIAITAANYADFANQCSQLSTPFPFAEIEKWQRRAAALAELEKSKLDLIQQQAQVGGSAVNAFPAIKTVQVADLNKQAFDDAESFKTSVPLTNLTNFAIDKAAHDVLVAGAQASAKAGLSGGAGWRFYAASDVDNALQSGTPGHEYTITAIILFQGDVSLLTEIIQ